MDTIIYWRELQRDFLAFLKNKGYEESTLSCYQAAMNSLTRYANARECPIYTPQIGQDFIKSEERLGFIKAAALRSYRKATRRLDEFIDGEKFTFTALRANYICPEEFSDVRDGFLRLLKKQGLKERTVGNYRAFSAQLFQDFIHNGITSWNDVNAKALTGAFERSPSKCLFAEHARQLFKYLVNMGIVKYDYSGILPKVYCEKKIPSVYHYGEVETLLMSVNRASAMGKRDYAVILLALRLGLRAADIRLLKFSDVDFDNATIRFSQYKTENAQRLTLLPEVAEALHDYIDNGRGESDKPYIFLTNRKTPFSRSLPTAIATKYFKESGIDWGDRKHGSHALRSTLASELVEEGVPFEVIRKILGHEDPKALTYYVKFATKSLRFCALEVPAPRGRFASYLSGGKGVN
jgi:site-specific recombinase XerD